MCPACKHHVALHCGLGGRCVVKQLVSGYPDFASLPECGCQQYESAPGGTGKLEAPADPNREPESD